ncbi:MAG: hypothetical protein H5T69_04205 [Chloroflexi bacterium]|nr:hypothetical protein [Chloroflexota bacterium]
MTRLSPERKERLLKIEALVRENPGITLSELADLLGTSPAIAHRDVAALGIILRDGRRNMARFQDLYWHNGLWCIRCDCGAYVPVCAEEGEDECPMCGRAYAMQITRV